LSNTHIKNDTQNKGKLFNIHSISSNEDNFDSYKGDFTKDLKNFEEQVVKDKIQKSKISDMSRDNSKSNSKYIINELVIERNNLS